ncbi:MAG: Rrf2 family transcriptional regulator [Sphingobacteriia bacterium]|nr:Rrf2 family transcriptional regulator [Sphingobacteriia bacterium]
MRNQLPVYHMTKLFNISEASNIAVHSLSLIALSNKPLNTGMIAEMLKLSRNHIAKVLQILTKLGIVSSGRGPKGGFVLLIPPEQLSLFEIYEMIDGKFEADHCRNQHIDCPFEECVYGNERQRLFVEFKKYYSARKLTDIQLKLN